jgi:hypothetical protein
VKLGKAFDVVGDRTQSDFQFDTNGKMLTESFTIKVRNRKAEAVNVTVREYLYRWSGWEIMQASQKYDKRDAQTLDFPLSIAADGEAQVKYTVRYKW